LEKEAWDIDKIDRFIEALKSQNLDENFSEQNKAILSYADKLTRLNDKVGQQDVNKLREVGFDDLAIHDICAITAYFAFVNRMAEGLRVELEARFGA